MRLPKILINLLTVQIFNLICFQTKTKIVQETCYVAWHSIAYGETAIIFPMCHCLYIAYTCVFAQCMAMLLAATMLHCVNKKSISGLSLSLSFTACLAHISIYIRREEEKNVALVHLFRFFFSLSFSRPWCTAHKSYAYAISCNNGIFFLDFTHRQRVYYDSILPLQWECV